MSDYFFVRNLDEEWTTLYEKILRQINREWESHTRYYDRFPEVTKENIENNGVPKTLPHLLPLAAKLQNDKSLHCLMPWQHHGILTLLLMDWEKQITRAFVTILPNKENEFQVSLYDENLPYSAQPLKTIESVPLGEIRSLIHAELQTRTAQ